CQGACAASGWRSPVVETEMLAAVSDVLKKLGFEDFTIQLNHRQLLTATLNRAGIQPSLHTAALVALDKLDKIGPDRVIEEMVSRNVPRDAARAVLDNADSPEFGSFSDEQGSAAVQNLRELTPLCGSHAA